MGRPRLQRGWITEQGPNWRGEYYETVFLPDGSQKRIHRSVVLGQRSQISKTEAKQKLDRILARYQGVLPDSSVTLAWFVENKFLPIKLGRWKASTKGTSEGILKKQVSEPLGDTPIREFDRPKLQAHLNRLAEQG